MYKIYWKGDHVGPGGVGMMVKKDLMNGVMEVKPESSIELEIVVNK